ncbi:hypothetical protein CPB83DRAFT_846275 [Crepidotus variabilis]|uniref:Uncharacterized protein n=1 Tax=Crepidotus variabilis TaxID=179855 RepID=A0A9P6JTT1_9AGAR|nr:hypothetical protein CPB83DRAFT_846275 [Crepidotus variabilis]
MLKRFATIKENRQATSQNRNENSFNVNDHRSTSSFFSFKTKVVQHFHDPERMPAYPLPGQAAQPFHTFKDSSLRLETSNLRQNSARIDQAAITPDRVGRAGDSGTRELITPESIYSHEALSAGSIVKDGTFPIVARKRLKLFLIPGEKFRREILAYMTSTILPNSNFIPLWRAAAPMERRTAFRIKEIAVGDVGYFDSKGGFKVQFNVFWDQEENVEAGFVPPLGHRQFVAPQARLFKGRSQISSPDGTKTGHSTSLNAASTRRYIDSDHPAMVNHQPYEATQEHFVHNMTVEKEHDGDEVIYNIKPRKASASFLFLPEGGTVDELGSDVTASLEHYLAANAKQWCQHFKNPLRVNSRIIFVSSVVLAKNFAAAIFPSAPRKSDCAQLRISTKDDTLKWSKVSDGFEKTIVCNPREEKDGPPLKTYQCAAIKCQEVRPIVADSSYFPRRSFGTFRVP